MLARGLFRHAQRQVAQITAAAVDAQRDHAGDGIRVAGCAGSGLSRHGHRTPTLERAAEVDPGLERYGSSMTTATLLASVLSVAPQPQPPPFEVADVEFEQTADTAQLTAFDSDGEVVGELAVWRDSTGQPMIAVTFVDGLYLFASIDGDTATIDSEGGDLIRSRLLTIQAALPGPLAIPQWMECAGTVVLAGFACAPPAGFIACAGSATAAGCACLETFTDGGKTCFD
jgi:hypothetical protein